MNNCTFFDEQTTVRGELTTSDIIVEGSFNGKIVAKGTLLLRKSAQINADINAKKLQIEEGAVLNGKITLTMNGEG